MVMAKKKRSSKCYKHLERPYTRRSKYRKKSFVKSAPNLRTVKFDMGAVSSEFPKRVSLFTLQDMQIMDNCLESARQTANKLLIDKLGRKGFHFKIKVFPHHILRYNPIAMGAGADRLSTGMQKSFGKPIGRAARVRAGQELMYIEVAENGIENAKQALKKAGHKLPVKVFINITR